MKNEGRKTIRGDKKGSVQIVRTTTGAKGRTIKLLEQENSLL